LGSVSAGKFTQQDESSRHIEKGCGFIDTRRDKRSADEKVNKMFTQAGEAAYD
jgi:hypothetical protein